MRKVRHFGVRQTKILAGARPMLKANQSRLDGGLYELAHVHDGRALLMSHVSYQPTSRTALVREMKQAKRRHVAQAQVASPSDMLTVKLISAAGANDVLQSQLSDLGIDVVSNGPQVLLANVSLHDLKELENIPSLLRAEQSRRLNLLLDTARGTATKTDIALSQQPHLRGQGVVVGIIDSGVDWRHGDFRHANGNSRIELFIHASNNPKTGTDTFREFSAGEINNALAGSIEIPAGDLNGHGTHCASIAAGNGLNSTNQQFRGVAPEGTLMVMRTDSLHDTHVIEGKRRGLSN